MSGNKRPEQSASKLFKTILKDQFFGRVPDMLSHVAAKRDERLINQPGRRGSALWMMVAAHNKKDNVIVASWEIQTEGRISLSPDILSDRSDDEDSVQIFEPSSPRRPSSSHKRKAESLEMTQMSSESEDESSEDEPSPPVFRRPFQAAKRDEGHAERVAAAAAGRAALAGVRAPSAKGVPMRRRERESPARRTFRSKS